MLLINLIFEFCAVIVQAGCTPRAWLTSDLATSSLLCNLYVLDSCSLCTQVAGTHFASQVGLVPTENAINTQVGGT